MCFKRIGALCCVLLLSGCISTQEMPLAPNVVRIDTQAGGYLFTGKTVPATMRAAAKATLDRGYTHFQFANAGVAQGSVVAGTVGTSNASYSGSYGGGSMNGMVSSTDSSSVIRAPTASAAATVIMYRADDPQVKNSFDAQQVLQQYPQ